MKTRKTESQEKKMDRKKERKSLDLKTAIGQSQIGMTIVELMIVLTIISSIMGVVGFYVFGALGQANIKEAGIEIKSLTNLVNTQFLASSPRKFPDSLERLTEGNPPLTKKIPDDPWGEPYVYKIISKREFEIYSVGPDGQEGTEDDIRPDADE